MFKTKCVILILIPCVLLLFSACSSSGATYAPSSTATNAEITSVAPINTSTSIPTKAILSPTSLPSIKTQCVADSKALQKLNLSGLIAIKKIAHQLNFSLGFFLVDANTKAIVRTDDKGIVIKISPDRVHLAYTYDTTDAEYIRVLDSYTNVVADFADFPAYADGMLVSYFDWQNKGQIRIVWPNLNDVHQYLINPYTQQRTELKTDWEGVYHPADPYQDKVAAWKFDIEATSRYFVYGANILYDPTLMRVIYPKDQGMVSLVNTETGAELAHATFTDWGRLPIWSPNGEYLTMLNRDGNVDNFYLITRDGSEFQRITDFAKEFGFVSISEYAWSPNGKQIAFWLSLEDDGEKDGSQAELAILDISTRQVTRLCIQGINRNAYEPWSMNHPEPIWSPDGKYLLISQWDDPSSPKNYFVLVIDPVSGSVDKISKNTAPIGWMTKEP